MWFRGLRIELFSVWGGNYKKMLTFVIFHAFELNYHSPLSIDGGVEEVYQEMFEQGLSINIQSTLRCLHKSHNIDIDMAHLC